MNYSGANTWVGAVNEDGSFSILARVVSLDGAGIQVNADEGNCLLPADVSSITCKVFSLGDNKDATTGTEITPDPTLTPNGNLFSTLRTAGWPVLTDPAGYNFRHDVAASYVPNPNEWYQVEYQFTLAVGGTAWGRVKVKTIPVLSS